VKVSFYGVRGSIPTPGTHTTVYGGNTSCLLIEVPGAAPLVLDCGTGVRALGRELLGRHTPAVEVLFTHFHLDHVFGFPFFGPLYSPSCSVGVGVPALSQIEAENRLGGYMNGTYHPVRLRDLRDRVRIDPIRPGRPFERGPFTIEPLRLNHPGSSCGYRIEAGGKVMAFLTDTAPLARPDEGLVVDRRPTGAEAKIVAAITQADLVVMDTMFGFEEYLEKMTWGHAYPEYAVALCKAAGVKRLALFHHSPDASDSMLDELAARWAHCEGLEVFLAREGGSVELEG